MMLEDVHNPIIENIDRLREALLADLYFFFFYSFARVKNITPDIPQPIGRMNHFRIMADGLMSALRGEKLVLSINLPPRYGKTEMVCAAIAWCYAHNPMANNIYGSYKKMLAAEKTESVRHIIQSRFFQTFFDARLSKSSSAKDNFLTVQGGRTIAVGADGSGLGSGAGMTGDVEYGGGIFLDDMLKAQDSHSRIIRGNLQRLYSQTLVNRRNNPQKTPIVEISQRTHKEDLSGNLHNGCDDRPIDNYQKEWRENAVIIPALDNAGNALWPEKHDKTYLIDLKANDPYTFYSQMQQQPISPANCIFNTEGILLTKEEPKIIETFIPADTAETADKVNDATVFSMWGVYEIEFMGRKTGDIGLHWIACYETRVEPQDLLDEFEYFYGSCLRHEVKPRKVFIEKKSTGPMLIGFLKKRQGLVTIDVKRDAGSGSKTERFQRVAPYVSRGLLSMDETCQHCYLCLKHLKEITFDGGQRHDDIADTMADAIQFALIDKVIYNNLEKAPHLDAVSKISMINRRRRTQSGRNQSFR